VATSAQMLLEAASSKVQLIESSQV